jgi:hypothetical protein
VREIFCLRPWPANLFFAAGAAPSAFASAASCLQRKGQKQLCVSLGALCAICSYAVNAPRAGEKRVNGVDLTSQVELHKCEMHMLRRLMFHATAPSIAPFHLHILYALKHPLSLYMANEKPFAETRLFDGQII